MWKRVFLICSPKDNAAACLKKVLAQVTDLDVELISILQNRGELLVKRLEELKSEPGYRILLGSDGDGVWEGVVAIVLRQGSNLFNPVLVCGGSLPTTVLNEIELEGQTLPLNISSILLWLRDQSSVVSRLTFADVEAAKGFLQVGWHDLKYDLLESYDRREERVQVKTYFQFLNDYGSAPAIKLLLGDAGLRVYDLGQLNRLAYEQRDDAKWNSSTEGLFASFDVMNSLSPRR